LFYFGKGCVCVGAFTEIVERNVQAGLAQLPARGAARASRPRAAGRVEGARARRGRRGRALGRAWTEPTRFATHWK